jgi:hypothetical protein
MKRIPFILTLLVLALGACNNEGDKSGSKDNGTTDQQPVNPSTIENPMTSNGDQGTVNEADLPVLTFERELYEFPQEIKEGERVRHSFKFTNTGKSELIITDATAPCGCTIPSFSKEPIAPGKSGKIDVEFNSEGKPGRNEKAVIVTSNSIPNKKELRFIIAVTPKQQ